MPLQHLAGDGREQPPERRRARALDDGGDPDAADGEGLHGESIIAPS